MEIVELMFAVFPWALRLPLPAIHSPLFGPPQRRSCILDPTPGVEPGLRPYVGRVEICDLYLIART